jgi:predicted nucleotide-binding protein
MTAPKVFISHSREDAGWVRQFAEALRQQNIDVWLDDGQVHAGDSMRDALEAGLRSSDAIVSVLSGENVRRPNVLFELGAALGLGKALIPIISPDVDASTIPAGFRTRRYLTKGAPDQAAREVTRALKGKAA